MKGTISPYPRKNFSKAMLASSLITLALLSLASCRPAELAKWSGPRTSPSKPHSPHPRSNTTLYLRTIGVQNETGFAFPDCWAIQVGPQRSVVERC